MALHPEKYLSIDAVLSDMTLLRLWSVPVTLLFYFVNGVPSEYFCSGLIPEKLSCMQMIFLVIIRGRYIYTVDEGRAISC